MTNKQKKKRKHFHFQSEKKAPQQKLDKKVNRERQLTKLVANTTDRRTDRQTDSRNWAATLVQ